MTNEDVMSQKPYVKRCYRPRGSARNAIWCGIRLSPEVVQALDGAAHREQRSRTSMAERLLKQSLGFPVTA
jgi:hypothetical protein